MVTWLDAQSGVLGSVLINPDLAPRLLAETSEQDYSGEYRNIYRAITALLAEGAPVDAVTIRAKLGPAYTKQLTDMIRYTPTSANFEAYIDATKEQSRLTALQALAGELAGAVTLDDAREILSRAQALTVESEAKRVYSMTQMLTDFYANHQNSKKEYINWGIAALDEKIYADKGDVVVIGGYPSDGKSALMLQFAYHMATKYRVGIFSFETSQQKITDRLVAHVMQLPFGRIKHSDLRLEEWHRISAGADSFTGRAIETIEASGMTVNDILGITLARRYDVIFIDYIQLIQVARARRSDTRNNELAEISKALHTMAQRHGVLVVELSQLTRPPGKPKDGVVPAPTMSSLRESGQLEQDADVIMLLYRTEPAAQNSPRMLHVAKNKEGELGYIELEFNGSTQTFSRSTKKEVARIIQKGLREARAAKGQLQDPDDDNPFLQDELPM